VKRDKLLIISGVTKYQYYYKLTKTKKGIKKYLGTKRIKEAEIINFLNTDVILFIINN